MSQVILHMDSVDTPKLAPRASQSPIFLESHETGWDRDIFFLVPETQIIPILYKESRGGVEVPMHGHLGHAALDHVPFPFISSFSVLIIVPNPIL